MTYVAWTVEMPRSSLPTCSQNSSTSGSTKLWAETLDLAGHPFRQCGRADAMSDADVVPGVLFCNRGPPPPSLSTPSSLFPQCILPSVPPWNCQCYLQCGSISPDLLPHVAWSVASRPSSSFSLLPSSPSGHRFHLAILKDWNKWHGNKLE